MKRYQKLWSVCLLVIGLATLLLAGSSLAGGILPRWAVRTIGIAELIALPVFVFCTLRVFSTRRGARRDKHCRH